MTKLPFIEDSPENDICRKCGQELGPWWVSNECSCIKTRSCLSISKVDKLNVSDSFDCVPEINTENTVSEIMLINLNEEDGT